MPKVIFEFGAGERSVVEVAAGTSVMRAAIMGNVHGIEADCGGSLSCATCHVYVREDQLTLLPAPDADEVAMLAMVAADRKTGSRLSCQLMMTEALDGLTVRIPARQS